MTGIIEKIVGLQAEVKTLLAGDKVAAASAHAGQVMNGLGHALDNANWFVEAAEKALAEAKAKAEAAAAPAPVEAVIPAPVDAPATAVAAAAPDDLTLPKE